MSLPLGVRLKEKRKLSGSQGGQQPWPHRESVWAEKLADGFPGGSVRWLAGGTYFHLVETRTGSWYQGADPAGLYSCLEMVYGIGPHFARCLTEEGYGDLRLLVHHPRWGQQARKLVDAIETGDVRYLARHGAREAYLLGYFTHGDTVFIDLETTGLIPTRPLFLIGTLSQKDGRLIFEQFLARCFEEEQTAVAAAVEHLGRFPVWVTFNGRAFDIPYLRTRAEFFGLTFPKPKLHIDLIRTSRRLYRGLLPDCRLTTLESYLLNRVRFDDVPGYLIPDLYHQFVVEQDPQLLLGILRHNVDDLHALSQLMYLVEEELGYQEQIPIGG